jgi:hypothetical protein
MSPVRESREPRSWRGRHEPTLGENQQTPLGIVGLLVLALKEDVEPPADFLGRFLDGALAPDVLRLLDGSSEQTSALGG